MKRIFLLLLFIGNLFATEKPKSIDVLYFIQPRSFIAYKNENLIENQITDLVFSNLIKGTFDGRIVPELAERWEVSPDRQEITLYLRKNVFFSNGKKFDAADVIFSFNIYAQNSIFPELSFIEGFEEFKNGKIDSLKGIQAINDYTVRIKLIKPFKYFLAFLSNEFFCIYPENFAGMTPEQFNQNPIGTGPFIFKEIKNEIHYHRTFTVYRFRRNENYFLKKAEIEKLNFFFFSGQPEYYLKLFFDIFPTDFRENRILAKNPYFRTLNAPFNTVDYLMINPAENQFVKDPEFRRFLYQTINRDQITQQIFENRALPAYTMVPYGLPGYNPAQRPNFKFSSFFYEKLNKLRPRITVSTINRNNRPAVLAEIKTQLQKYNIEVKIDIVENQSYFFNEFLQKTKHSVLLGAVSDYPSAFNNLVFLVDHGLYNKFKFNLPQISTLIKKLPETNWLGEIELIRKINELFFEEAYYIPLYYHSSLWGFKDRIKNLNFKFGDIIDFASLEVNND